MALECMKFKSLTPYMNSVLGKRVFRFQLERNAQATIEKELFPKRAVQSSSSHMEQGDALRADLIVGFSENRLPRMEVSNRTGSHKGHFCSTSGRSYAEIDREWPPLTNALRKKGIKNG